MKPARKDPAEEKGYLRYFYRDWHPTRLGRIWSRLYALVAGLGVLSEMLVALKVKDRRNGKLSSTILASVRVDGQLHIVSMLGDHSQWVENVRAAGGHAYVKHGRSRPVLLKEIPIAKRARILKQWAQVATSGRRHLPVSPDAPISAFEAIAADYPVFRIDLSR